MFLILMVIGLVGLAVMAIPAFARHGSAPAVPGHPATFDHGSAHVDSTSTGASRPIQEMLPASDHAPSGLVRWLPSPRVVFTVTALYGAFGDALVKAFQRSLPFAALAAVVPTVLVERLVVRPLWNLVFRFRAAPSSSLSTILSNEAVAVVPFRNGRGIVSTQREGRIVQLSARLRGDQASLPVKVGDRLRIEEVDGEHERVAVSFFREK